jgi:hypothetical protein
MKRPNVLHTFDFQLVRIVVAHHLRLFISEKRRKKGAHTFHGICWNFLPIVKKLKELKIINDKNSLLILTFFSPLYADVRHNKC